MWRSIGARARGAAHEGAGTLCQDAFAHACLGGGIAAIAVADGAGSATYARCGAELVVDRAIRYLRNVGDLLAAEPVLGTVIAGVSDRTARELADGIDSWAEVGAPFAPWWLAVRDDAGKVVVL